MPPPQDGSSPSNTGKVGLAAFLCKRRVPGFPTPACSCGAQWETAKHVILDCPRLQRVRRSLYTAAATTDYQVMISRPRPAAALTSWILRHGVLSRFSCSGAAGGWLLASHPPPPPPPPPTFHR